MSADVRVQLFNVERYRSTVLPAHERWVDGGDLASLAELLEAARERLPAAGDGLRGPRPLFLSGARIDELASALRGRPAEASRIRDDRPGLALLLTVT